MLCVDPSYIHTDPVVIVQIRARMINKREQTFDELRDNIVQLQDANDGVVSQAVIDSGFTVEA